MSATPSRFLFLSLLAIGVPLCSSAAVIAGDEWKAGVAVQVITPGEPMWMAGYASRNKPAEGKAQDLYVKALALETPASGKLVLLTSDLVGIPRSLSEAVAEEVRKRTGLPRERLMLTCSHTHCGPVLNDSLSDMYDMPPVEAAKIGPYTEKLRGWMIETVVKALDDLKPARLAFGKGTARFAVNRRQPTPNGIINGTNPDGPVDHDVPVLRVETPDGKLRVVLLGYACHNTTMQFYEWCGDYAGFAQANLEEKHPGAVAMFWIGCGADANPLPRSKLELCQKYGRELADAVEDVLAGKMSPVQPACTARYATIALPFDEIPSKEKWAADTLSKQFAARKRAERMLKVLEAGGKIDDQYRAYPVQVWRLGDELLWVALGGEVVVDYNIRLKKELGDRPALWITGYANDVMAYIPSLRVLKEGGYEGDTSQIPYGMPAKWGPMIEELIVAKVHELVKETAAKRP
jgi:Neutral/alkaline non-lysosomal ceramidase, N-terminal